MEREQLTQWNTGDLIASDRLNAIQTNVDANTADLESKFRIDDEHSIDNISTHVNSVDEKTRSDMAADLNTINQTLIENFINLFDSIKTIELQESNGAIQVKFTDSNIEQNTQVITEGTSAVTVLNSIINNLLEKINTKFTAIDNLLNEYEAQQRNMLETLPVPKIGEIYTTIINYETERVESPLLNPTDNRYRGNYLTILPATETQTGIYWIPFGQGRTLIGAGTGTDNQPTPETITFNGEDTGGEYNHKLITAEMPAHTHNYTYRNVVTAKKAKSGSNVYSVTTNGTSTSGTTSIGGNQVHNNLPPYIVVYFYKNVEKQEFITYYNLNENFEPITETSTSTSPVEGE